MASRDHALTEQCQAETDQWMNIETAPRDGRPFHVWADGYEWPETVRWEAYSPEDAEEVGEDGYWTYAEELLALATDSCCPEQWTHWRDLPAPPSSAKQVAVKVPGTNKDSFK